MCIELRCVKDYGRKVVPKDYRQVTFFKKIAIKIYGLQIMAIKVRQEITAK
jgi:hypothetical protein